MDIFSWRKLKRNIYLIFQTLWIICVYNIYSKVVLNTFFLLKCIKLDESSDEYLENNPDILCWYSSEHQQLLLGAFLPCLILWCLGWPFYIIKFLYSKNKLRFSSSKITQNFIKPLRRIRSDDLTIINIVKIKLKNEEESFNDNQKIFKYLTMDYNTNCYFWEFYFYFTNLILSCLAFATSRIDPVSQGSSLLTTLMVMLIFSEYMKPFKFEIMNKIQVNKS